MPVSRPLATTDDALLTVACAAQLMHCSTRHVYRKIKDGTMAGVVRIGVRAVRINRAKLLAGEL
jgi:excisionase family DNA binding protein